MRHEVTTVVSSRSKVFKTSMMTVRKEYSCDPSNATKRCATVSVFLSKTVPLRNATFTLLHQDRAHKSNIAGCLRQKFFTKPTLLKPETMIHSTFAASVKALAIVAAVFLAFHGAIFICTVSVNSAKMHEVVTAIWLDITAAILFVEIVKHVIRRAMLAHQIMIRRAMLACQFTAAIVFAPTKAAIIVVLILYHTIKFTVFVVKTPHAEFRRGVEWRQKRKLAAIRVLAPKKYYPTIQEPVRARKNNAAVKIQSDFRRHEARKKLEELQAAKELRRAIQSAIMMWAILRGQSATKIQSVFRRHQARKELEKLRRDTNAAVVIQSVSRRHQAKKRFQRLKSAAIRIQAAARGREARNAFARQRGALVRARVKRAYAKQCHRFFGIFGAMLQILMYLVVSGAMLQILMYLVMSYSLYTPPATTTNFTDSMPKPFEDTMVKFLPLADDEIKAFVRETQAAVEIQNVWRSYKEKEVDRIKRQEKSLGENRVDHKKILERHLKKRRSRAFAFP